MKKVKKYKGKVPIGIKKIRKELPPTTRVIPNKKLDLFEEILEEELKKELEDYEL